MVEIFPGAERPYYIKSQGVFDGTYVRVAGTTRHVEDYMLRELMLEGKNRYFDSEICQNMDISDSEQLGLSVGGVRYHINKLKKDGVVEHIGSSKKGTWVIHD